MADAVREDGSLLLLPTPMKVERLRGFVQVAAGGFITYTGVPEWVAGPVFASVGLKGVRVDSGGAVVKVIVDAPLDLPTPGVREQRYAMVVGGGEEAASGHHAERGGNQGPLVRIASPSITGARLGLWTLAQLIRRFGESVPAVMIEDQPAFRTRGAMLDVSRCRVPTMPELLRQVDLLASWKVNHLQLYTEHTFAYKGHQAVWDGWSPMTAEQVRELDQHCRARGIELAANQNCFGHLTRWLDLPAYAHLAETHGDWMFDVWPRKGPWSLCPTDPASVAFVGGLLEELLPNFSCPLVNIGCDEVYDIAYGRSAAEVARRGEGGRASVFVEFVNSVCAQVGALGKRPMFWADMLTSQPEAAAGIDPGGLALVWGYEPDHDFATPAAKMAGVGREVWVCPGTSSWLSFFGRTAERRGNIAGAVAQGAASGASGVLTTDWGDKGHRQQRAIGLLGLAHGAAASWNPRDGEGFDARSASLHALGDPSLEAGPWIEKMGDVDALLRACTLGLSRAGMTGRLRNAGALAVDMDVPIDERREAGSLELWRSAAEALGGVRVPSRVVGELRDELEHALDGARLAAARAVARRYPGGLSGEARAILAEQCRGVMAEHARLWHTWCRPGGLTQSMQWYERVAAELRPPG
ncbi:MAG: family 20 glycosylhydrolase [Phycisphaerales bacterium]|nr:family 20 glycosylhydrolase [Phycisphaerales bacterium]